VAAFEGAVVEEIEKARRTGQSAVVRYGISDEQAWSVGLGLRFDHRSAG
jgi:xanthine/CO dehydrogenase XdhC/CoxF family maturation factor